jgi:DNA polymerase-1
MLFFDLETDGFLEHVTQIHCVCINGDLYVGDGIPNALQRLADADVICGHNVIKYDIPVIQKLVPGWRTKARVVDTLVLSRLIRPEVGDHDDKLIKQHRFPAKYRGLHKLEAWGYRLGVLKDEYDGGWESYNDTMGAYCVQDVVVTKSLFEHLCMGEYPHEPIELEHKVAMIVARQERNGFSFNREGAIALLTTLSKRRLEIEDDLKREFKFWYAKDGSKAEFTPKADNKAMGYTKGAPLTKIKRIDFNPGSRHHIAYVLRKRYGWKPVEVTETGQPKVDEQTLMLLPQAEIKPLLEYLMVEKRLGFLAEGKQSLMKFERNGKIHGDVSTLGAVTCRMTHSNPNVAQTPASYSPYGTEFRALFSARPGWKLIGCDAASLELRIFAHYMALYDGGVYARAVVNGNKADGTDVHSVNAKALGLDPHKVYYSKETGRDIAKRWFYAFLYGAGDPKLGSIITNERDEKRNRAIGKKSRARFLANLPALKTLIEKIKENSKRGWLKGLDGRRLIVRSQHAAPNLLFQAAGAIVMKWALVWLDEQLQHACNFQPGGDYEFCANVHDEWQTESKPELGDQIGELACESIRQASKHFNFRCPLDGEYAIGTTWADTH